tara:strand:+ start:1026 stop:2270 length:1245 start_codon:yes stop_codon:yes gene_type:complete
MFMNFEALEFNSRKQILFGADETNTYFIKIQIIKNQNKENNIREEYEIIKHLNQKGSKTCPIAYEIGRVKKADIYSKVDDVGKSILDSIADEEFEYIIQDFIPDSGEYNLADVLLTMIEQRKLGIYQGDIKPANIRYDSEKSTCYFIDYDQAIWLDEQQVDMKNPEFLKFCSEYDRKKYGIGDWLRHFSQYTSDNVTPLFRNGALNLEKTTIFNAQNTTNTPNGIYHSINEQDIFIAGARTVDDRASVLDNLTFLEGEKVLDVGCNSGLLSMYLHDRGCDVVGVDNDPHIVIASKIVSNILGKDIEYSHMDLDFTPSIEEFDTVMLFSVLHHTRNPVGNAKKIAQSCSRVIIEARLTEQGKQPVNGVWTKTVNWSFGDLDEMVSFFEKIFDGFKLEKDLGVGDKRRSILEFRRK